MRENKRTLCCTSLTRRSLVSAYYAIAPRRASSSIMSKPHRASNDGCREHVDRREQAVEGVPANLLGAYSEKAPEREPPPSCLHLSQALNRLHA